MDEYEFKTIKLEAGEWAGSWADARDAEFLIEFQGKLLTTNRIETWNPPQLSICGVVYSIYITPKGKIVYYKRNWENLQGMQTVAIMEVFDNIEVLKSYIPIWLYQEAQKALGKE